MKAQQARRHIDEVGINAARQELRNKRESVGLSQFYLAKLSGVPASNINRIEIGKQAITPRTLARLMTALERFSKGTDKDVEALRGLALLEAARAHVARGKSLPFL